MRKWAMVEHNGHQLRVRLETERVGDHWQRRAFTIATGWDVECSEFWRYGSRRPGTDADLLALVEQKMAKAWTDETIAEVINLKRIIPRVVSPKPWLPEREGPFPPCCALGTDLACQVLTPTEDDAPQVNFLRAFEARLRGRPEERFVRRRRSPIERAYLALASQKPPSAHRIEWWRHLRDLRERKLQPVAVEPRLLP